MDKYTVIKHILQSESKPESLMLTLLSIPHLEHLTAGVIHKKYYPEKKLTYVTAGIIVLAIAGYEPAIKWIENSKAKKKKMYEAAEKMFNIKSFENKKDIKKIEEKINIKLARAEIANLRDAILDFRENCVVNTEPNIRIETNLEARKASFYDLKNAQKIISFGRNGVKLLKPTTYVQMPMNIPKTNIKKIIKKKI